MAIKAVSFWRSGEIWQEIRSARNFFALSSENKTKVPIEISSSRQPLLSKCWLHDEGTLNKDLYQKIFFKN